MLERFLGKTIKLVVRRGDVELIYTHTHIEEVNNQHVVIVDKFGTLRTFLVSDVVEISEVRE